ncbi:MAG TPA: class I SAM-dependent methyltransferase, partial [Anaeromyxobacter sp.]
MVGIAMAERGLVPEGIVRAGIRKLLRDRLRAEGLRFGDREAALEAWVAAMATGEVAPHAPVANAQHYEVPAAFFATVLGRRVKYSSGFWPEGVETLDGAEEAMLDLTAARAELADGQRILDLGCGWGSFALHAAARFPAARITAVSNSASQGAFVLARARASG